MNLEEIKDDIKNNELPLMKSETIKEVIENPVHKSIYKSKKKEDKKDNHWSDRIECKVCGGNYQRSNSSAHKKTKLHLAYEKMNTKLKKILINN